MKTKFILLTLLLLFSRGCDFYSTSLWIFEEDGLSHETNPLTQLFGFGWNGLLISNAIIISLIIFLAYLYYFKNKRDYSFENKPKNYQEFISLLYFNKPNKYYQAFYRIPTNKKTWLYHAGYVLIRVCIFASFMAAFHNICQYYNYEFYNIYRDIVHRPLYVIYGLIMLSMILTSIILFKKEYKIYEKLLDA